MFATDSEILFLHLSPVDGAVIRVAGGCILYDSSKFLDIDMNMEMKVPVFISVLESTFNINPRRNFVRARGTQQQPDKNRVIFSTYNANAILMGADPCDLTVSIPSLCEAYGQTC
jgi:hypothetical protein